MEHGHPNREPPPPLLSFPSPPPCSLPGQEVEAELLAAAAAGMLRPPSPSAGEAFWPERFVLCLYAVGFLDFFGVSMIVPLLSLHVKSLGVTPTIAGLVGSLYGILQLFSSTLVGSWSDVVGRPYCLLVCILFSALGYYVLSMSTNIILFSVARIFVGLFKHTHSVSKVLISDLVSHKKRLLVIGHFNAASSIGFILGPVVGGYLTELEGGFYLTAFICASIFLLNAGLFWMLLRHEKKVRGKAWAAISRTRDEVIAEVKESLDMKPFVREAVEYSARVQSSWAQVVSVVKNLNKIAHSDFWDVFLVRLLMSVSVMLYHSNFVLALEDRFGMKPKLTGYLISYSSTLGVATGFLLGPVTRFYHHNTYAILFRSSVVTCVFTMVYALSENIWTVILSSTFLAFSTTVGRTCITDLELTLGGNQASGMLIGIGQSVSAIGRIIAPLLSGIVQEFSSIGPPILGSLLGSAAVLIMYFNKSRYSGIKSTKFKSA